MGWPGAPAKSAMRAAGVRSSEEDLDKTERLISLFFCPSRPLAYRLRKQTNNGATKASLPVLFAVRGQPCRQRLRNHVLDVVFLAAGQRLGHLGLDARQHGRVVAEQ